MGQGAALAVLRAWQHMHAHAQAAGAALQCTEPAAGLCKVTASSLGANFHSEAGSTVVTRGTVVRGGTDGADLCRHLHHVQREQVLRPGHHAVRHDVLLL